VSTGIFRTRATSCVVNVASNVVTMATIQGPHRENRLKMPLSAAKRLCSAWTHENPATTTKEFWSVDTISTPVVFAISPTGFNGPGGGDVVSKAQSGFSVETTLMLSLLVSWKLFSSSPTIINICLLVLITMATGETVDRWIANFSENVLKLDGSGVSSEELRVGRSLIDRMQRGDFSRYELVLDAFHKEVEFIRNAKRYNVERRRALVMPYYERWLEKIYHPDSRYVKDKARAFEAAILTFSSSK